MTRSKLYRSFRLAMVSTAIFIVCALQSNLLGQVGTRFAAIWVHDPGTRWSAYWGMSSTELQSRLDEMTAQGFRPIDIEGYLGTGSTVRVPNLTPFQPLGWSDRIVVSNTRGTHTDSGSLFSTDKLFVDWAVWNNGTGPTDKRFVTTLSVDGQEVQSWFTDPPHRSNYFVFIEDFELGPLSPGTHTLKLVADSTSQIKESNESDNEFTRTVQVIASEEKESQKITIIFPRVQEDTESGTGLAIANPTDEVAEVTLFLYENNGGLKTGSGITNPTVLSIPPNKQIARTVSQLFGEGATSVNGWIEASSENLGLVGFFLSFSPDFTKIDGAEASLFQGTTLVFPEVFSRNGDFTEINLIGASSVVLELYSSDGNLIETTSVQLPFTGGRFTGELKEIFSQPIPPESYVLARSKEFFVIGYESFGSGDSWGGRNAIPVSEIGRSIPLALFGAYFADRADVQTVITIINPTDVAAQLTFSAFGTGVSSAAPVATNTVALNPKSMLKVDSRSFLGLPTGDFAGWLRIDSDVAGIVGDLTFGDPNGDFLSSVQLQNSPVRDVVFSYIADGLGFITGITFLNPSADPATVTVEAFSVDGDRSGTGSFVLQPFEHRAGLLPEFISGFQPQIGGHLRVTSDIDIFTFELFSVVASGKLTSLAAVPPQRGQGNIAGKITPAFVSTPFQQSLSRTREFRASHFKGISRGLNSEFVPGEVIVKLHPRSDSRDLLRLNQGNNLQVLTSGVDGVYLLQSDLMEGSSLLGTEQTSQSRLVELLKEGTLALAEELNSHPDVVYAEPNYIYHAFIVPNDTHYDLQWHYSNIKLPAAWDITTGDTDVVVAVIDTGAKFDHPDLGPRLTGGQFDFIRDRERALDGDGIDPNADDPGDNPSDFSSSFHGTHVAGTIGAVTNNALGVAGVNWNSPLMTLRVLGKNGGTSWDIAQAIRYAARLPNDSGRFPARKANVVNMSLGSPSFSQFMAEAVAAALAENVVIVAAAGNENSDEWRYPASYDGVISVGATDLARGKAPYSSFGTRIDVVAPGGDLSEDENGDGYRDGVLSTLWGEKEDGPIFDFYQGTSMASPHVAGVASLMLSVNPELTPAQVRQILQDTAIDLEQPGRDDTFGYGLVDPVAALQAVGTAAPGNPQLVVSTSVMNFGTSLTQLFAAISNNGGGTLSVNSPSVEVDQAANWLSTLLSRNTLIVNVERSNLARGNYTGRIRLTSNGGSATIEVLMEVGGDPRSDLGPIFVVALDPATFNTIAGTSTDVDSSFKFEIPPITTGVYFIAAGSDLDEDGFICDEGEYCGFYPVTSQPSLIEVQSNKTTGDITFTIEKDESQPSRSGALSRKEGFEVPHLGTQQPRVLSSQPTRIRLASETSDFLEPPNVFGPLTRVSVTMGVF